MSRLVQHEQYATLLRLRNVVSAAVAARNELETHTAIGRLQGFLIGLHSAGEIEADDVTTLENDMLSGISFLINARKAGNVH
jgi:hypothetical protein